MSSFCGEELILNKDVLGSLDLKSGSLEFDKAKSILLSGVPVDELAMHQKAWLATMRVVQSYASIAFEQNDFAKKTNTNIGILSDKDSKIAGVAGGGAWLAGDALCRINNVCDKLSKSKDYKFLLKEHGDFVPTIPVLKLMLISISGVYAATGSWEGLDMEGVKDSAFDVVGDCFDSNQQITEWPTSLAETIILQRLLPSFLYLKYQVKSNNFSEERAWRRACIFSLRKIIYEAQVELALSVSKKLNCEGLKNLRSKTFGLIDFDLLWVVTDMAVVGIVKELGVRGKSGLVSFKSDDIEWLKDLNLYGADRVFDGNGLKVSATEIAKSYAAEKALAFAFEKILERNGRNLRNGFDGSVYSLGKACVALRLIKKRTLEKWVNNSESARSFARLLIINSLGSADKKLNFSDRKTFALAMAIGKDCGDPFLPVNGLKIDSANRMFARSLSAGILNETNFIKPISLDNGRFKRGFEIGSFGLLWYLCSDAEEGAARFVKKHSQLENQEMNILEN
jgi:hypothetical protein